MKNIIKELGIVRCIMGLISLLVISTLILDEIYGVHISGFVYDTMELFMYALIGWPILDVITRIKH